MKRICVAAVMAALAPSLAAAHPHILVEYAIVITLRDGKFAEARMNWTFDPLYSELARGQIDRNKNGKFEADEIATAAGKVIPTMKPKGFYTHVTVSGQTKSPEAIERFDATASDDTVSYQFSVALDGAARQIAIGAWDADFYIDFSPAKIAFKIEGGEAKCEVVPAPPIATADWGTIKPSQVVCKLP